MPSIATALAPLPLLSAIVCLLTSIWHPSLQAQQNLPAPSQYHTPLTSPPDWRRLEDLQQSITEDEFLHSLQHIYSDGRSSWEQLIQTTPERAHIRRHSARPQLHYRLQFGNQGLSPEQRGWRKAHELPPAPADQPLQDLRVAIDPGHLGGEWARMEGRHITANNAPAVKEGVLSLAVAQRLRDKLEAQGAEVAIIRPRLQPVTPLRPEDLHPWVEHYYLHMGTPKQDLELHLEAERFFYQIAEIRARAELLHQSSPAADVAICLHFNAAYSPTPANPQLVRGSHMHILVNGCYSLGELRLDDQRQEMLWRLLSRTHEVEIPLATAIAEASLDLMQLPPFTYTTPNARSVNDNPYVWARNLLANRIFPCPVIYMEPYLQNGITDHARIQAGAYEGMRTFNGQQHLNIFDEYAETVARGMIAYYRQNRPLQISPPNTPPNTNEQNFNP